MSVNCMMAHDPWERLGLEYSSISGRSGSNTATRSWPIVTTPTPGSPSAASSRAAYELAAVSLRPGGTFGIGASERIEDDTMPVLRHDDLGASAAQRNDFIDFIYDTERSYWSGMYRFLKDDLGVRSLVSGTQLGYSAVGIQAGLDYIDAHSLLESSRSFPAANGTRGTGSC